MSIFSDWKWNWFGYTMATPIHHKVFPFWQELVDGDWNPTDHVKILAYLDTAPVAAVTSADKVKCPICGRFEWNPSLCRSDGICLWPGDLGHYVAEHQVRLPDRFVEHIRSHAYLPASIKNVRMRDLPWPPNE